ncbi:MAG: hypothetical protein ABIJ86_12750 [Spirochaetota bacterium]
MTTMIVGIVFGLRARKSTYFIIPLAFAGLWLARPIQVPGKAARVAEPKDSRRLHPEAWSPADPGDNSSK